MVRTDGDVLTFSTELSWGAEPATPAPQPETTFVDWTPSKPQPRALGEPPEDDEEEDPDFGAVIRQLKVLDGYGDELRTLFENEFREASGSLYVEDDVLVRAIQLVTESSYLGRWTFDYIVSRADAAIAIVEKEGVAVSAAYVDSNFEGAYNNWDDFAEDKADEAESEASIPSHLEHYFSFDRDQWMEDEKENWHLIEVEHAYNEILVFSL